MQYPASSSLLSCHDTLLLIAQFVNIYWYMYVYAAGTGNVLKIQSLLHTCSEFYKSKDKEGGDQPQEEAVGSSEATPISGKPEETTPIITGGGEELSKSADDKSSGEGAADKGSASDKSASKKLSGKDVEMKDAEQMEPGAINEPGSHQAICVLGIALIAMGEDVGAEMALRTFSHLVSI